MKKKKSSFTPTVKALAITVLVVPALVFFRGHLSSIWAQPEEVSKLKTEVKEQKTALEQVAQLSLESKKRQDLHEAVYSAQMESINKQVELIASIKKK